MQRQITDSLSQCQTFQSLLSFQMKRVDLSFSMSPWEIWAEVAHEDFLGFNGKEGVATSVILSESLSSGFL